MNLKSDQSNISFRSHRSDLGFNYNNLISFVEYKIEIFQVYYKKNKIIKKV